MPVASGTSSVPAISKVGSWSNFVSKDAMRFDEAKSTWLAEVEVRSMEHFLGSFDHRLG